MLSEIFSNKPRCQHFHEDGKRCKADPQTNNKFCFMHDPEQKEKQAEARKKGGLARFQLWERKMPANFKFQGLEDEDQVSAFLDAIAFYYIEDQIDLRSARFLAYIANSKQAQWNAKDRRQYRTVKSVEQQARILARERDPWSPAHGVLRRATKAKEEAAKTGDNQTSPYEVHPTIAAAVEQHPSTMNEADPVPGTKLLPTNPSQERRYQEREQLSKASAMPSDVALSFRELGQLKKDELKKEEERKEQERAAARRKLSQESQQETQESSPPKHPPQAAQFEQKQQRMIQNDMNQLAECVAEQVRAAAAAKAKKYGWRKRGGTKY